jgi:uncharacterized protein
VTRRQHRLSRSRDFDTVYRKGRSVSTRFLVLYSFPREDDPDGGPRLGLAVSRQLGGAVERNRLKRRLRAAFDELAEQLPAGAGRRRRGARVPLALRARGRGLPPGGGHGMRHVVALPIHAYRALLSPLLGARCKYHPSCSRYALDALAEFGVLRGLVLAGWRLLRCNPWSRGGVDYAHDQTLFRAGP